MDTLHSSADAIPNTPTSGPIAPGYKGRCISADYTLMIDELLDDMRLTSEHLTRSNLFAYFRENEWYFDSQPPSNTPTENLARKADAYYQYLDAPRPPRSAIKDFYAFVELLEVARPHLSGIGVRATQREVINALQAFAEILDRAQASAAARRISFLGSIRHELSALLQATGGKAG